MARLALEPCARIFPPQKLDSLPLGLRNGGLFGGVVEPHPQHQHAAQIEAALRNGAVVDLPRLDGHRADRLGHFAGKLKALGEGDFIFRLPHTAHLADIAE